MRSPFRRLRFSIVDGYNATMTVARDHADWLDRVDACHRYGTEQIDNGVADGRFAGAWILKRLGLSSPPLVPLVRWNILERVGDTTQGGHRAYYRVKDLEGIGRALHDLGRR